MTLSVKSAVYQQSSAHSSFDGSQLDRDRLNSHHSDYRNSVNVQSYSPNPQNIPSVNLNAAISSSLRLKSSNGPTQQMDSPINLLNNYISFHQSPAQPLDAVIKAQIEKMPNSTILLNNVGEKNSGHCKTLFSDTELIKCCKCAQSALPSINLGLQNVGNTCYLNSVLQCLLATGALLHFVKEKHSTPNECAYAKGKSGPRFCVLCGLYKLFQAHCQENNSSLVSSSGTSFFGRTSFGSTAPTLFTSNVRAVCSNLRAFTQEDAHEYLLGLLSRMEDCVITGVEKLPRSILETNVIRKIFGGVTRSEVVCSTCHIASPRNDQWFNLSMDIVNSRSLQQCLINYTQTEILYGANAYKCENCKQLRHARRCSRIFRAPPILIVQFNRFSRNLKLDYHVDFPASFNMRPHMTPSSGVPVIYQLYATLNHEGFSCRSGHYVAFTKRRNQWFSHNDSIVTSTTQDYVMRQCPYLLFYQLASPEDVIGQASTVGRNGQLQNDSKMKPSASPLNSLQSGPGRGHTSPKAVGIRPTPVPSSPAINRSKSAITFHPRVLAKSTPLLSKMSSAPTSAPALTSPTNGVAPTNSKVNGNSVADVEASAAPKVLPTTTNTNCTTGATGGSSPLQKLRKQTPPKLFNSGSFKPISREIENNHRSSPHNHNGLTSSSSSSSCGSESTESSVEWIPMTKDDLMQQGPISHKRNFAGSCDNQPSSSTLNSQESPILPHKIPRREFGNFEFKNMHHSGKRHKKIKEFKRRHRHHGKHRHKKWRQRDFVKR